MKSVVKRVVGGVSQRLFGLSFNELLRLGYPVIQSGAASSNAVALTFDDGPSPFGTAQILEILREHNAKATFFLLGHNISGQEQLLTDIASQGHEIGSHGSLHLDYHWSFPWTIARDVRSASNTIVKVSGREPLLFRAPYGHFRTDLHSCAPRLKPIGWSVAPPWDETDPAKLSEYVLDHVEPGSIVLLHDGIGTSKADPDGHIRAVVEGLPGILSGLKERGLNSVTVSSLLSA